MRSRLLLSVSRSSRIGLPVRACLSTRRLARRTFSVRSRPVVARSAVGGALDRRGGRLDHWRRRLAPGLVVGANDVVNPLARNDASSPIYGMPILDVDKSALVVVIKRSLSPGYAGIDNPLFYEDNTLMLFADAKAGLGEVISAVKEL